MTAPTPPEEQVPAPPPAPRSATVQFTSTILILEAFVVGFAGLVAYGLDLAEPQEQQRRDEENPPAHAEHARQDARGQPEADRGGYRPAVHSAISRIPITASSAEKARVSARPERRCWTCVPTRAPATAGMPTRSA